MQAFKNLDLSKICDSCGPCAGFTPGVSFAYDAVAKTVTLTSTTAVAAGDTFKHLHGRIHDQWGKDVPFNIAAVGGNSGAVNVASLNANKGLSITATAITAGGCVSDGSAMNIPAAGVLAGWDKDFTAAETNA